MMIWVQLEERVNQRQEFMTEDSDHNPIDNNLNNTTLDEAISHKEDILSGKYLDRIHLLK